MTVMLDRANVNGPDNYLVAHTAGARWGAFKATEGTGFTDSTYHTRRKAAREAGIITGAYMFSDNTDPVLETEHFLDVIGDLGVRRGELRPTIDIERSPHGIPTLQHSIAMAEHLHKKLGYWPTVYGSTSVLAPYRAESIILRACPWWRAEYGPNDGLDHTLQGGDLDAAIHQYTSVGRLSGISGFTDLSHILRADQMIVPTPKRRKPRVMPATAWRWARWRLGLAEYEGHRQDPELRPSHAPHRIPLHWYGCVRWYKKHVINPGVRRPGLDEAWVAPKVDGNGAPYPSPPAPKK